MRPGCIKTSSPKTRDLQFRIYSLPEQIRSASKLILTVTAAPKNNMNKKITSMILYDYFRSSASYRVRIALNLKQVAYVKTPINLVKGEQASQDYKHLNPQGLVPALHDEEQVIYQSLAICEYLDEKFESHPLLPKNDLQGRAYVRALANTIACDIHPLNNLRVLKYLENTLDVDQAKKMEWYSHWLISGLEAIEETIKNHPYSGAFCYADTPSLADITLIPQLYNAKRFNIDYSHLTNICEIERNCLALTAFINAHPDHK